MGVGGGERIGVEAARCISSLCSLLFSYSYDYRLTGGDEGVETPWTLVALTPLLSWLDDEPSNADTHGFASECAVNNRIRSTLLACVRRALIYPYLRRWDLAALCVGDVASILLSGRRAVIRSLLSIKRAFSHCDSDSMGHYYLMNTLFVDDFLIWAQGVNEGIFAYAAGIVSQVVAELVNTTESVKSQPPFEELCLNAALLLNNDGDDNESLNSDSD